MQLLSAIESVMQDTSRFGQKIVGKPIGITGVRDRPRPFHRLPARRRAREVLDLLAQGLSDTATAAKSDVTSDTVRNHVAAIYKKLGVNRCGAAVAWARERGFGAEPKILTKLINLGATNGRSNFVQGTR
jgi:DNA-binding NarL/FixJ family response regulator